MITKNATCGLAIAALTLTLACGRTNNAVDENRPDGAAVDRAARTTNTTDGRDVNAESARGTAGTTGQKMDRAAEDAGDTVRNGGVTTKVQAKFALDDIVKARRIDVDTKDGVVTLNGSVMSKAESDRAERLARETEGVKRVVNNLKVDLRP
jgi:hyperosmotically inducible protein